MAPLLHSAAIKIAAATPDKVGGRTSGVAGPLLRFPVTSQCFLTPMLCVRSTAADLQGITRPYDSILSHAI